MSTNSRWKRLALQQNQQSSQQTKTSRCTTLTRVPEGSQEVSLPSRKRYPVAEQVQTSQKVLDQVRTPASSSNLKVSTRTQTASDDLDLQCIHTSLVDKSKRHEQSLLNNRQRKVGCTSSRCLVPCSSRFSTAPSLTDTASSSATLSVTSSVLSPPQSSIKSTWKKIDEQRIFIRSGRLRLTETSLPHYKIDHRLNNEDIRTSATASHRVVKHKENVSGRPSTTSQKEAAVNEIPDKNRNPVLNAQVTTSSLSKLKRPKTELPIRAKSHPKSDVTKVRVSSSAKLKKRHRRRKTRTGESKNSSLSGSSNRLDSPNETVGVNLIAAGQHGFFKNSGTGSDSVEPSFTTVNVDALAADLVQNQVEIKITRVVGTSIPDELVRRRGVYCPHPNHRSVCTQTDGAYKTPGDAKTLFQRLLPRINSLGSTKRKQPSLNTSLSGQSCYSSLLSGSGSRTYHGSRSEDSGSERGYRTAVDVHYGSSGNVRAVLRVSSNTVSKYSSRSSAVWSRSGDRLTPIIQGVSLTPPRTPLAQQKQTQSCSVATSVSRRSASSKKHS